MNLLSLWDWTPKGQEKKKFKLNQHAVQEKKKKRTFECAGRFSDFFIDKMKEAKFREKKTDCLPLVFRYVIFIPLIIWVGFFF